MMDVPTYSTTALKRWSCQDAQLPPVSQIQDIHIYDFDNTLFASPMPNRQLWNGSTCGLLQSGEILKDGGWWHNPEILAATGEGEQIEETRAWKGFWNESIVELVQLSMQTPTALTVLLTGRSQKGYTELLSKMLASKGLQFDLVALKPAVSPTGKLFSSTLQFKEAFLRDLIATYATANEVRMYEDRSKHVKSFTDFFFNLNSALATQNNPSRPPLNAEVIQVTEEEINMDSVTEVAMIQKMINRHNEWFRSGQAPAGTTPFKIKKSTLLTGYMVKETDIPRLRAYVNLPPQYNDQEVRYLANNIVIAPRPPPRHIMQKVGGIGAKVSWRATGVGIFEDRVWALRVQSTTPGATIHTENNTPCVVLATRRQGKPADANYIQNWQPIASDQAFEFETTVGEKSLLRIEEELHERNDDNGPVTERQGGTKHFRDEDFPALGPNGGQRGNYNGRKPYRGSTDRGASSGHGFGRGGKFAAANRGTSGSRGHSRGGNNARTQRGRGGRNGRGGAPRGAYRSLDDGGNSYSSGGMQY